MISRIANIIQKCLMLLCCVACVACLITKSVSFPLQTVLIAVLMITCVWQVFLTRCPHCGRFGGIKPKPFAKDAGKCIHCRETVEYR